MSAPIEFQFAHPKQLSLPDLNRVLQLKVYWISESYSVPIIYQEWIKEIEEVEGGETICWFTADATGFEDFMPLERCFLTEQQAKNDYLQRLANGEGEL